jgi:hypothetical protein
MDLFSSCLLMPYDTAIWWHMQRHSSVYAEPRMPTDANKGFLEKLLVAVLDAIAFETQSVSVYQSFTLDPTLASLFRGFVLAQRVMLSFNLHSSAIPALEPMASHQLWNIWDIAIDICISLEGEPAEVLLYDLCMKTFDAFASPGVYPICTHFMLVPAFRDATSKRLLRLLDESTGAADIAARSSLRTVLVEMEKPTEAHLLMLAKMQVSNPGADLDNQMPIALSRSKKMDVLKCGMLNVCLAISRNWLASFNKLTQCCIDWAGECAPMSGLLLGLLIERGGRMLGLHGFASKFVALCDSPAEDVRATAVFLLGCSGDAEVVKIVDRMSGDQAAIVREQAVYALAAFAKAQIDKRGTAVFEKLAQDDDETVRKASAAAMSGKEGPNPILDRLVASVRAKGFLGRYRGNIFDVKDAK